jgi:hypothetical protein
VRQRWRWPTAVIVAAAAAVLTSRGAVAAVCVSGSLDVGDPTQTGRLARAGAPGATVCGTWHSSFGLADEANQRFYDIYPFTNATAADACTTFTLVWSGTEAMFEVAYTAGQFAPADIQSSYLGDGNAQTSPMAMGIVLPAGGALDVVVHAISPGVAAGGYTLIRVGRPRRDDGVLSGHRAPGAGRRRPGRGRSDHLGQPGELDRRHADGVDHIPGRRRGAGNGVARRQRNGVVDDRGQPDPVDLR